MSRFDRPQQNPDVSSATPKQRAFLARHDIHFGGNQDSFNAKHAISRFVCSRRQLSPTARQEAFLRERGLWRDGMNRGEAFDLIGETVGREKH